MPVEPVGPGVQVDAGITSGDEVTLHYDPMIAKLIALGEDRARCHPQDGLGAPRLRRPGRHDQHPLPTTT